MHVPAGATSAHGVVPPVGVINESLTTTLVRFAVPVLVAVIVYVSVSPTLTSPLPSSSALLGAGLSTASAGFGTGTVSPSVTWAVWSLSAAPVFTIDPAVTSAAVTT